MCKRCMIVRGIGGTDIPSVGAAPRNVVFQVINLRYTTQMVLDLDEHVWVWVGGRPGWANLSGSGCFKIDTCGECSDVLTQHLDASATAKSPAEQYPLQAALQKSSSSPF